MYKMFELSNSKFELTLTIIFYSSFRKATFPHPNNDFTVN